MTLHSEVWGKAEKPGTMMDTQTFIRDDHPGIPRGTFCNFVAMVTAQNVTNWYDL